MRIRLLTLLVICCSIFTARANHGMGGEITWRCNGNGYVFELVFYRNCNGGEINTISENIRVWNHPTITSIQVNFISREDISPTCTPVAGSPPALDCGTGANAGNGNGAIEKIIYQSNTIILNGTPPAAGWIFTYDNFSRSSNITNLVNPGNYGFTTTAKMFAVPGATAGVCTDNSPRFLESPYLVICSGENYAFNQNAVDIDLDSLHFTLGTALDYFPTGNYNPPVNPIPIPYETGFSPMNPTPDASIQVGNVPTQLDPQSGELSFKSFTTGSYVVKIITQSFRKGILIAEVEREMQITVESCNVANNAPVITPPFSGLFQTTVDAGTLVTFNIQSTDVELLQDGTPQNNILTSSGLMYGTNFTSTSGCSVGPCATLNQTPAITGVQGVNTQFSWQTDCAHSATIYGDVPDVIPYYFIFKVQDNYCQIPKTTYKTVIINVRNPGIIPATQINCITTAANGDVTVSWDAVADPNGTFVSYELRTVQNGLVGTYPMGTTTATIPSPGAALDFYVNVISGCNGNAIRTSDTLRNVFLTLLNPNDGTAKLLWNRPSNVLGTGSITILREYPTGTWTTVATLPFSAIQFIDTIDICSAFLNYMVIYHTPSCDFNSNSVGDNFVDMLTPDIPILGAVSVDTVSGNIIITWNQNYQLDTYGYVIYMKDANGFLVEIDTVWGITNTSYTHVFPINGPITYSVSAFDSCFTSSIPQTYQTSAKGNIHTTMYLTHQLNVCDNTVELSWTDYFGWGGDLVDYTVFKRENGSLWTQEGTTTGTTFTVQLTALSSYCFSVRANNINGTQAFSNLDCFTINGPTSAAINYLRVATVQNKQVVLRHEVSIGSNVSAVSFEKYNPRNGLFEPLEVVPATSNTLTAIDPNVDVSSSSYRYRAVIVDSCGHLGEVSNEANTILLEVLTDQTELRNYLHWTDYSVFDGTVVIYHLFRGVDGIYDSYPLTSLTTDHRFYEDDVSSFGNNSGRFCYYVVAQEGDNQYGFAEYSNSNDACTAVTPLVYIPNAFTPGGVNPIFLPIVSFTDLNDYELTVFDRWGQRIFNTKNVSEGWDGTHRLTGELVDFGMYNYVVHILDGNDQELMYRGNVTVIR